jgi:hypothetical protein
MSIIKKIIDLISFFKNKNEEQETLQDGKKDFSTLENYIKNIKKTAVSLKLLLENINNILENFNKKNNNVNDTLLIQIRKIKNIAQEFEKVFTSLNEAKTYFYDKRFEGEFKILNKDYIIIEKIYSFVGNEKDEESLINKLIYVKKEKIIKKKKYILKNQINRLENKLNNLNEIIARIEKIYLDEL